MVATCNPRRSWLDMASPNVARYRCCHIGETVHLEITGPTRGVFIYHAINFSDSLSLSCSPSYHSLCFSALSLSLIPAECEQGRLDRRIETVSCGRHRFLRYPLSHLFNCDATSIFT